MTENKPKILCVDDEPSILMSLKRVFRQKNYSITLANSGAEALEILNKENFDLIISDLRMPEMDGATFLSHAAKCVPNTRRVLLTGFSEQEATVRAINDGKINQYVTKPWDNNALREVIDSELEKKRLKDESMSMTEALEQENDQLYEQVATTNHELDETVTFLDMAKEQLQQSCYASIKTFANLINMRIGITPQTMERITEDVSELCDKLGITDHSDLQHVVMLCQLGKIGFSDQLLQTPPDKRTPEQQDEYQRYPELGEAALLPMAGLSHIGRIIRHQNENFDGSGVPDAIIGKDIPLTARILRVVVDYHMMMTQNGFDVAQARDYLTVNIHRLYDPGVVQKFLKHLKEKQPDQLRGLQDYALSVKSLKPYMVVTADLFAENDMLLITKDTVLSQCMIDRLAHYEGTRGENLVIRISKTMCGKVPKETE